MESSRKDHPKVSRGRKVGNSRYLVGLTMDFASKYHP
jgi:hypothetical protein